jgi:hypothetical protein
MKSTMFNFYIKFMNTKIYQFSSLILILLLITSCDDEGVKSEPFKQIVNLNMDNFNNLNCIVESAEAHSGKKICHLDSGQIYGFYYSFNIPDSLIGKDISVALDSWVKTGKLENKCALVCSVTNQKDSILNWQSIDAMTFIKQPHQWSNLSCNFIIPANLIVFDSRINVMCYNTIAASYFDVDDLQVIFSEKTQNNP